MQLRDFFAVPHNQKVTEQHLFRFLTFSVCSILLCMSCLVGTTWAWFTVSVENTGNVIEVGEPGVRLMVDGNSFVSGSVLTDGSYLVSIEHGNQADDLNAKSELYVTITTHSNSESQSVYTVLNHENQYMTEFTLNVTGECSLSWEVSWFAPNQANPLPGDTITVTMEDVEEPAESTETPAESTGSAQDMEATDNTTESIAATEHTQSVENPENTEQMP